MLSIDALKRNALFVGVGQPDVEAIWAFGKVVSYSEGDRLFERGSEANEVMVVESGSIELFFPIPILGAVKEVVVEQAGPGDVAAWSALVSPYTLTLSARGAESGQIRTLARNKLDDYCKSHPQVGYAIMNNLAGIVGHRLQDAQNLWLREMQARITGQLE